ncbi:MAG: hypothetical protein B6D61_10860 [Bacteroidetes bacterium 4484_249]|nr:MAG: hypothetical protein B6D61_10860 [Bacteroidetes bacterium 4484_249]
MIMKITIYISFLFLFFQYSVLAQNTEEIDIAKSLIFIEAGGSGGYGSVNYEYLLKSINKIKLSVRIGFSTYHITDYTNSFNPDILIPIAVNAYYGLNHNIDFSIGQTISNIVYADNFDFQPKRKNSFNTNLSLGYRYQKETGGFMCKIAYSPIIENNKTYRNWISLSLGYAF